MILQSPTTIRVLRLRLNKNNTVECTLHAVVGGRVLEPDEERYEWTLEPTPRERRTINLLQDVLAEATDRDDDKATLTGEGLIQLLQVMGEHLLALLFQGRALQHLVEQLEALQDDELDLLRVELEFADADHWLAQLPWEYLYLPEDAPGAQEIGGEFLSTLATTLVLNRRLPGARPKGRKQGQQERPRVLLVVCGQRGDLAIDPHEIVTTLTSLGSRIELDCELVEEAPELREDYEPRATWAAFQAKVRELKPHVIHFVGHGERRQGGGRLAFVGDGGEPDWIPGKQFAHCAARSSALRLVFLHACEGAALVEDPYVGLTSVASELARRQVPAVVAMQEKVTQTVASAFATGFYEALADHATMDVAVRAGRWKVRELKRPADHLAFGLPVVYLRDFSELLPRPPQDPGYRGRTTDEPGSNGAARRVPDNCPRCDEPTEFPDEQAACMNCGLLYRCTTCNDVLRKPLKNFCQRGHRVMSPEWRPQSFESAAGAGGSQSFQASPRKRSAM